MTVAEMAQAQPLRAEDGRGEAPATRSSKLATRMAVADRHVERFRVLNGLGDNDRVRPGDYMKMVVE